MSVRILIADDHDLLRGAIAELLRRTCDNWEVCCEAADGGAAIQKASEFKPDLVILDVLMPVRDGISAGREIHTALPNAPILLYTILASPALEADAKRAGFHAVVPKYNAAALITAIRSALSRRGFSSGQPPSPSQPRGPLPS
ncbi:MAG TPA: response regulator transcription factor [Verrucomicrobiae bacterium]|nr:response regulator transcription factor [Verrucomicrobiae bacterium]